MNKTIIIFFLLISISSLVWSADFQKGYDAYNNGDYATALQEWIPIAKNGDTTAQYNLGLMYLDGVGVSQDYQEAVKWFQHAAEQGHGHAQYNLGISYQFGRGVPQDYQEAMKWYLLAVEDLNIEVKSNATHSIGYLYEKGMGVSQDYQEAVKWYRSASELGDAHAQYNLGVMYLYGRGVKKDYVLGYMWFEIAANRGYERAVKDRDFLRNTILTSRQLKNAQKLFNKCVKNNYEGC